MIWNSANLQQKFQCRHDRFQRSVSLLPAMKSPSLCNTTGRMCTILPEDIPPFGLFMKSTVKHNDQNLLIQFIQYPGIMSLSISIPSTLVNGWRDRVACCLEDKKPLSKLKLRMVKHTGAMCQKLRESRVKRYASCITTNVWSCSVLSLGLFDNNLCI